MKILTVFKIILIFILQNLQLSECLDCNATPKSTELRLKQKLLCSYDKDTRPNPDSKNGTVISVRIYLKSFDYNEYYGSFDLNTWLGMRWIDSQFKWDPAEYEGIESLTIHSDEIWMPDLAIYNSRYRTDDTFPINPGETPIQSTQFEESCSSSHCVIYSSGSVSCTPPCSHTALCHGVYTDWPYDIQNCSLHFGSWMHKGSELSYKAEKLQIDSEAITHSEWKIISLNYKNIPGNYSCCPNDTYPSIKVNVVIQRHSASEASYIITPALILCAINLILLWLSPSCIERIMLNVVSLFAHFTYLQQLSWLVPKNGDTCPKAITFFRDSIIISTVLLLQTIILRGLILCKSETPNWIKSTTESLKGNKFGQLMFTNPYLINREANDDVSNLVEEQSQQQPTTVEANNLQKSSSNTNKIWIITARILDTLMFLAVCISYIILFIGWLPNSNEKVLDGINAVVII